MARQSTREPAPQPVLSPLTATAVFLVLTTDPGGGQVVSEPRHRAPATPGDMPFGNPGRAEFGTYFIGYAAPSADFLDSPPGLPSGDGSLGIGSLK